MKVNFIDVGRNKKSWEAEFEGELTYEFLYGQVKSRRALASDVIDFYENGRITAGIRTVGRFEVVVMGE